MKGKVEIGMGLFDKKYCDVCGEKIGLLGNRKLKDGNLCKNCAKKLSPWFSERRQSTLAEIKAQLAYREKNEKAVASFHATRTLGKSTMVILDEDAGNFMVATQEEAMSGNPDVLSLTQILGCNLDTKEYHRELTRTNKDGKQESYNPPQYEYNYDFYIVIQVDSPYFSEMRFRLNDSTVVVQDRGGFGDSLFSSFASSRSAEYSEYARMSNEIIETLIKARDAARQGSTPAASAPAAPAAAPAAPVKCPYCGAETTPNQQGCCEFCGGKIR